MRRNKNDQGFIPMIVIIVIVLGSVIWLGYKHVNDSHKKALLQKASQKASQYENTLNR